MKLVLVWTELLVCGALGLCAEPPVVKTFELASGERLQFAVPATWHCIVTNSTKPGLTTVWLSTTNGDESVVLITLGRRMKSGLKAEVNEAAAKSVGQSEEQKFEIIELTGKHVQGYYFSMTDRAPKPGEFKYLTQGIGQLGDVAAGFTILSNDASHRIRDLGLGVVRSGVLVKDKRDVPL